MKNRAVWITFIIAICAAVYFFWTGLNGIEKHAVVTTVPESQAVVTVDHGKPRPIANVSEGTPSLPVVAEQHIVRRNPRGFRKMLKMVGLDPEIDLIGEFLSGKRDRGKYLRALEFLKEMGVENPEQAAALEAYRADIDAEKWKERWRKIGADKVKVLATLHTVGARDAAKIAQRGSDADRALAYLLGNDSGSGGVVDLAKALKGDAFIDDPEKIAAVKKAFPESSWSAMLEARKGIETGDWEAAAKAVPDILAKQVQPHNLGTRDALAKYLMETQNMDFKEAEKGRIEGMLDIDAPDYLSMISQDFQEEAMKRQKTGDDSWVKLAQAGLAIAEAGGESFEAGHWEASLSLQKRILQQLGEERAQQVLTEPYAETMAKIDADLKAAIALSNQVHFYANSLPAAERLKFNELRRVVGDQAAMAQVGALRK